MMNRPETVTVCFLHIHFNIIQKPLNEFLLARHTGDMEGRDSIRNPGSIGDGPVLLKQKLSTPEIANFNRF